MLRRASKRLRETVAAGELVSRGRTVARTAPEVLDPRDVSRSRVTAFATSLALLVALLYVTPFLPLLAVLALAVGLPWLYSRRSNGRLSKRARSFSRRE